MVWIVKRDGRKEIFDRKKIIRTCIRSGASKEIAEEIAREVEKKVYDGINTEKILQMVLELLEEKTLAHAAKYDLKMALFRLGPTGYEFEKFVKKLLEEYNFKAKTNVYVSGKCVTHEIDVIAEKNGKKYMIECKFHNIPGSYTGLKEVLYTYARFLDLKEGFSLGKNDIKFESAWLFTNTKFSSDAKKFARCKGILLTGWKYPRSESIERMLERKKLYPITVLRSINKKIEEILINSNYVFCRDIIKSDVETLSEITNLKPNAIKKIIEEAQNIVNKNG